MYALEMLYFLNFGQAIFKSGQIRLYNPLKENKNNNLGFFCREYDKTPPYNSILFEEFLILNYFQILPHTFA